MKSRLPAVVHDADYLAGEGEVIRELPDASRAELPQAPVTRTVIFDLGPSVRRVSRVGGRHPRARTSSVHSHPVRRVPSGSVAVRETVRRSTAALGGRRFVEGARRNGVM
jgi:hypothetical protein